MPSCCRKQNADCQHLKKPQTFETVLTVFDSWVFLIFSLFEYLNSPLLEFFANGLEEKAQC